MHTPPSANQEDLLLNPPSPSKSTASPSSSFSSSPATSNDSTLRTTSPNSHLSLDRPALGTVLLPPLLSPPLPLLLLPLPRPAARFSSPLMFAQPFPPILPPLLLGRIFPTIPLELLVSPNLPQLEIGEEDGEIIEERVMGLMRAVERTTIGEGGWVQRSSGSERLGVVVEEEEEREDEEDDDDGSTLASGKDDEEEAVESLSPSELGARGSKLSAVLEDVEEEHEGDVVGLKGDLLEAGWWEEEDEQENRSSASGKGTLWV